MSSGERPIGVAKGKQPNTEALCQPPPTRPPPLLSSNASPPPPPQTSLPLGNLDTINSPSATLHKSFHPSYSGTFSANTRPTRPF